VSRKKTTPNSRSYLCQKLANTLSRKFAKKIITDPTTPKTCRYTTLQNIRLQKLHRPKAQQWQTRRAHTDENVTAVGELVLSQ